MLDSIRNCLNRTIERLNIIANLTTENVALRHQLIVLKRNQNRPKLKARDLIRAKIWVSTIPGKEPTRNQRQDNELKPFHSPASFRNQESSKVPAPYGDSRPAMFSHSQAFAQLRGTATDPIHGRYIGGTFRCSRFAAYALHEKSMAAGKTS